MFKCRNYISYRDPNQKALCASVVVIIQEFGRRVRLKNTWEKHRTMEGEEESSLDVTGDDIDLGYEERPVNRYGSPTALPESTNYEEAGPS